MLKRTLLLTERCLLPLWAPRPLELFVDDRLETLKFWRCPWRKRTALTSASSLTNGEVKDEDAEAVLAFEFSLTLLRALDELFGGLLTTCLADRSGSMLTMLLTSVDEFE